ncbi:hypothetical protein Tdes44962_MAKER00489 [Teratosphaeria destructans]|uniref:Uncharacterized protein n=1 Tax=Teratosphaeria destructans TaxID=418781 RepID=A0A9W7W1M8_9PEZI|nr:hypothetical protein Tdes44962_MAKER00489 [Teratosphaeria destructans]
MASKCRDAEEAAAARHPSRSEPITKTRLQANRSYSSPSIYAMDKVVLDSSTLAARNSGGSKKCLNWPSEGGRASTHVVSREDRRDSKFAPTQQDGQSVICMIVTPLTTV